MLLFHILCFATAGVLAIPPPINSNGVVPTDYPRPEHGMLPAPPAAAVEAAEAVATPAACTSRLMVNLMTDAVVGATRTVHPTTVVTTVRKDCHGCGHLEVVNIGGIGPVRHFEATVTAAEAAVLTAYACLPTPVN